GAHVAQRLALAGKSVIVLEDGGFWTSDQFKTDELASTQMLYQELGLRGTTDQSIRVMQGRAVGGTTVVNWTTCFRTPERVFDHWHEHHGVEGITHDQLVPHWERIEERLNVTQMTLEQVNKNNMVTWRGAEKLGWSKNLLRRNVKKCAHTGLCGMGCPIDAKQSMLVTMLPEAVRAGADIYANAWVHSVVRDKRRCTKVIAKLRDPQTDRFNGVTLTIVPKVTVLAGGAINTPAILLRSNIDANGRTGMRTFLHPAIIGTGFHPERIEPFTGAPQYVHVDQFVDRGDKMGMLLEGGPVFPAALGSYGLIWGEDKQKMMELLAHVSITIAILHDGFDTKNYDEGGMVTVRSDGAPRLDYHWSERLVEGMRHGQRVAMQAQLAGGAKQVMSGHPRYARSEAEIEEIATQAPFGPNQVPVLCAHVMGGCPMGTNERKSIVDSRTMRHHGFDNMFVIDGSVYPTSLTVNPQLSIYGLASWASQFVEQAVG
ncbi:MAG TPA: GMC family oxidoreductase, partial [Polyangiales bacterium]